MKELGGIYIIATIAEPTGTGWRRIGYKVMNYPACTCKLLSEESLLKLCENNNLVLKNACFDNGKLVGTQGSLNRYTCLNAVDGKSINGYKAVILGKNTEGYYIVVDRPDISEVSETSKLFSLYSEGHLLDYLVSTSRNCAKVGDTLANGRLVRLKDSKMDNVGRYKYSLVPIQGTYDIINECPKYLEKIFDLKETQDKYTSPVWKVRIVKTGEKYGLNYCLTNKGKPLVEFYDMSVNKKSFPVGQLVASYYLESLLFDSVKGKTHGICLAMDIPTWRLLPASYSIVLDWLESLDIFDKKDV